MIFFTNKYVLRTKFSIIISYYYEANLVDLLKKNIIRLPFMKVKVSVNNSWESRTVLEFGPAKKKYIQVRKATSWPLSGLLFNLHYLLCIFI